MTLAIGISIIMDIEPWDENSLAIVSTRIRESIEPVRQVWHAPEGDWIFSCNTIDADDDDNWVTIHVQHVIDYDHSLSSLRDLPKGWAARRESLDAQWERHVDHW